jgi:hypothetical protein
MRCRLALPFAAILVSGHPTAEAVGASMPCHTEPSGESRAREALVLEVRVFNGLEEVTAHTRLTVHRAGERSESIPHSRTGDARVELQVPAGIYDVQAIHERDGRVLNIRWANRLVVMPYPDERGRHLEVINFKNGFGALQLRAESGQLPELKIYEVGKRDKPVVHHYSGPDYTLFIVPAGTYDVMVRSGQKTMWMPGVEVPLDRTRLSIVPPG